MRIEILNLDGQRHRRTRVYDMPVLFAGDFWRSVTNVPCPAIKCAGIVRWREDGYVPGYRVCDTCGRHYLARGSAAAPVLARVGSRRER